GVEGRVNAAAKWTRRGQSLPRWPKGSISSGNGERRESDFVKRRLPLARFRADRKGMSHADTRAKRTGHTDWSGNADGKSIPSLLDSISVVRGSPAAGGSTGPR